MLKWWQPAPASDQRAKSPGAFAATGSRDKAIRIWDTQTGQCLRTLVSYFFIARYMAFSGVVLNVMVTQIGHDNWIHALVFHPCGKYLLSASDDKTVKVWDLAQGRCIKTIEAHERFVTCMTWGRALIGGAAPVPEEGKGGDGKVNGVAEPRRINVIATGSVDFTVKVSRLSGSAILICPWLIDLCLNSDMDAVMVAHQNRIVPEGHWQDETSTCKLHEPGVTDYDYRRYMLCMSWHS